MLQLDGTQLSNISKEIERLLGKDININFLLKNKKLELSAENSIQTHRCKYYIHNVESEYKNNIEFALPLDIIKNGFNKRKKLILELSENSLSFEEKGTKFKGNTDILPYTNINIIEGGRKSIPIKSKDIKTIFNLINEYSIKDVINNKDLVVTIKQTNPKLFIVIPDYYQALVIEYNKIINKRFNLDISIPLTYISIINRILSSTNDSIRIFVDENNIYFYNSNFRICIAQTAQIIASYDDVTKSVLKNEIPTSSLNINFKDIKDSLDNLLGFNIENKNSIELLFKNKDDLTIKVKNNTNIISDTIKINEKERKDKSIFFEPRIFKFIINKIKQNFTMNIYDGKLCIINFNSKRNGKKYYIKYAILTKEN